MRALEYLRSPSRIWAIEEGAWQEMVTIAKGDNLTVDALEARLGKMDNKSSNLYDVVEGVAVIPVIGPIVKYGNLFSEVSGATSISKLDTQFNAALNDENVHSILFNIDSPGGEANGVNEFSEQIYEARGLKPIEAYVSGQGCSAAYWIASSCDRIWQDETASTGSIGVATVIEDDTEAIESSGTKVYKFVSEGSENKRPDLDTEEGKEVVMNNINYFGRIFRSKIARNRSSDDTSLTSKDVIEKFNRGGTLMGEAAVKAGLADGISSFKRVLSNLIENGTNNTDTQENFMSDNTTSASAPVATDDTAVLAQTKVVEDLSTKVKDLSTSNTELLTAVEAANKLVAEMTVKLETELKAKADVENANLKLEAEAAASAKKIIPAKREAFVKSFMTLSQDDKANPIDGESRLDTFLGLYEGSTEDSILTEEVITVDLSNTVEETDDFEELMARANAFITEQNLKASK